ncbi:MAG: class I SAM-dependent methyltransferase [Chloroflexi bacterium SZAS-1]|jgi:SAM-dependent methyltransferase|nr:class I SAM-dependent methyltransferase [Chloroflexi bacterium SZAS-1]HNP86942.1 class I SAM-dependent methyltransferase [Kouleothrix sp.]
MIQFDTFARYYDADYGAIADDVPFYRELARRSGGRVLEAMCGSGRLLLPLAEAGMRVAGIDISGAMLARARARLQAAEMLERVELMEGDICTTAPQGPFGLAIVAINSFMHLERVADQLAALGQLHAALRPGGLLALDLFNPDVRALANENGALALDKLLTLADGTRVQKFVAQQPNLAAQINHVTFMYDELDAQGHVTRTVLPFPMRWLYRYELEHLLARAGFALEAVYGSYDLEEYDNASELLLVVARKIER